MRHTYWNKTKNRADWDRIVHEYLDYARERGGSPKEFVRERLYYLIPKENMEADSGSGYLFDLEMFLVAKLSSTFVGKPNSIVRLPSKNLKGSSCYVRREDLSRSVTAHLGVMERMG